MSDTPNDSWTTKSAKIKLDRNGGGFLALDLVAPGYLRPSANPPTRIDATRFIAKVTYGAEGLPAKKIPCQVRWSISVKMGKGDPKQIEVAGPSVEVQNRGGSFDATLDLMTAGQGFGAFLEAGGGELSLRLLPDYPHVREAVVAIVFHHALTIRLFANEIVMPPVNPPKKGKDNKPVPPPPAPAPEAQVLSKASTVIPRIGEAVTVTLDRSQWLCHVRLRVDTPDNNDVTIDYPPGASGAKSWLFGCSGGDTLQLPVPKAGLLRFALLLEVSADGKEWAAVHSGAVTVSEPTLSSFAVGRDEKHHVVAHGAITGFAPSFKPPFSIQLWAMAAPDKKGAASAIQPVSEARTPIGALGDSGTFQAELPSAFEAGAGTPTLFGVLRAPVVDGKLTPIGGFLRFEKLRPFSDEDLLDKKGAALGVCSQEVAQTTQASRSPVAGAVSISVVNDTIAVHADVLGPASYWKEVKPTFGFRPAASAANVTSIAATYSEVPGSARGVLVGSLPFKQLAGLAGLPAVVQLATDTSKKEAPAGIAKAHCDLHVVPQLLSITWRKDKDPKKKKDQIHLVCTTHFYPEMSEPLLVTVTREGAPYDAKLVYEHPAPKGGKVDDEGLEFFVRDAAKMVELAELLEARKLELRVSRVDDVPSSAPTTTPAAPAGPPPSRLLYGNPNLVVEPITRIPTKLPDAT